MTQSFSLLVLCVGAMLVWQPALASEVKAMELNEQCSEVRKGKIGRSYDHLKAQQCLSYMKGFADSMIITNKISRSLTRKNLFCPPQLLPISDNIDILSKWIKQNKRLAPTTTASVALFAAFTKAFPCK